MAIISRIQFAASAVLALASITAPAGCRRNETEPEVFSIDGKVEKITVAGDDADTGQVTVTYRSEKHDQEIVGTGVVTKDTEVLINGAAAKLRDIREGERVRGQVLVEKKGKQRRLVVRKIYIDRASPGKADG